MSESEGFVARHLNYGNCIYDFCGNELICNACEQAIILEFPASDEPARLVQFCKAAEDFMTKHEECGA